LRQAYDYWQDQPGFSGEIIFLAKNDLLVVTELTDTICISCTAMQRNGKFLFHTIDLEFIKVSLKLAEANLTVRRQKPRKRRNFKVATHQWMRN